MPIPGGSGISETGSYVQPLGDSSRRVGFPRVTSWSSAWTVDAAFTHFEGRVHPVAARGTAVTSQWTVALQFVDAERGAAEGLAAMLRGVLLEADARLELHLEAHNATPVDEVVECHEVPVELGSALETTTSLTFQQVDV